MEETKITLDVESQVDDSYDDTNWQKEDGDTPEVIRKKCFYRYVYGEPITAKGLSEMYGIAYSRMKTWSKQDSYVENRKKYEKAILLKDQAPLESDQLRKCRELYIETYEKVEIKFLAEISGYSVAFLQGVCDREQWEIHRRAFQVDLRSEVRKVKVKKYAEMVAERNQKAIEDQLTAYKAAEDITKIYLKFHQMEIKKAYLSNNVKKMEAAIAKMSTLDFKRMVEVMDRVLDGQRKLLGLEYFASHSAAVSLLLSEGYAVRPRSYVLKLEAKYNSKDTSESADINDVMNAAMLDGYGAEDGILGNESELPGTID